MPWFKVDDTLAFHHKTIAAGNAAMGLWMRAGAYCSKFGKDGYVPHAVARELGTERQARALVNAGLWLIYGRYGYLFRSNHPRDLWSFESGQSRPKIPDDLRQAVYARDGHACLHCGTGETLSLDHIHPFSLGGTDTFDNLQTLCRSCNSRKGARV